MLKAFTRNYEDNSTEAGFQFTFYCDCCQDGVKSSFIESETYKKGSLLKNIGSGLWTASHILGGRLSNLGWSVSRGTDILSERFSGMSPEWHKEHDAAFERAQNESRQHFHRCHGCNTWVCDTCFNEEEGLCTTCAPRESVSVAKAKARAIERNIDELADTEKIFTGKLTSRTTVCPDCGKPAGEGKFCNNCGASLSFNKCPSCGKDNPRGVRFCNQCGSPMTGPKANKCSSCGEELQPGAKFCGNCGNKIG